MIPLKVMPEQWIIRVADREYGPATLEILREWKEDGRVLSTNQARRADENVWLTAAEIPGLFQPVPPPPVQSETVSPQPPIHSIWKETFRIYGRGFFQFLCLALLVIVPAICGQLTSAALETSENVDVDFRGLLAAGFAFCMFMLSLLLWPVYVAGIQILTAELAASRRIRFFPLLNSALRFWPRLAMLCLYVYGAYFFWTVLPLGLLFVILYTSPSLLSIFIALLLLAFWVWIIGRLFVNFLFWPQLAVLAGHNPGETLQQSKQLARSGRDLQWYRRPLWRGIFIVSLWFAFVLLLNVGPIWPLMRQYFQKIAVSQSPEALVDALKTIKTPGFDPLGFCLGIVQGLARPILGIAFVLLYFNTKARDT